jgi:SAM-dependent methyltransferase
MYSDKDYDGECEYLEKLIKEYGRPNTRRILELGCGTGNYTLRLAKRGLSILAVDSSPGMLYFARRKASLAKLSAKISFVQSDIRRLNLGGWFDCCIAMFAVLNYVRSSAELLEVFRAVHDRLKEDGILVFDVWNGLAVIKLGPSERIKDVRDGNTRVIRIVRPTLDMPKNECSTHYTTTVIRNNKVIDMFQETHQLHYFLPQELTDVLKLAGFDVLSIHPFLERQRIPTFEDWNITVVARKA